MVERKLLTLKQVSEIVGLKSNAIYKKIKAGEFPRQRYLSKQCVRWYSDEIQNWINGLPLKMD